jgi:V/A-type H+-transporting ATPase subunit B
MATNRADRLNRGANTTWRGFLDDFERGIDQTLDLGWQVLAHLPREDLLRIKKEYIEKYMNPVTANSLLAAPKEDGWGAGGL